jgi:hypothetical protein
VARSIRNTVKLVTVLHSARDQIPAPPLQRSTSPGRHARILTGGLRRNVSAKHTSTVASCHFQNAFAISQPSLRGLRTKADYVL